LIHAVTQNQPLPITSGVRPMNEMEFHKETMSETLKRILALASSGEIRVSDHGLMNSRQTIFF
jgi:hypothetical protein